MILLQTDFITFFLHRKQRNLLKYKLQSEHSTLDKSQC